MAVWWQTADRGVDPETPDPTKLLEPKLFGRRHEMSLPKFAVVSEKASKAARAIQSMWYTTSTPRLVESQPSQYIVDGIDDSCLGADIDPSIRFKSLNL